MLFTSQCLCHEKTEPHGCVEHRTWLLLRFIRVQMTRLEGVWYSRGLCCHTAGFGLEKLADRNLMKFDKGKCQVLHLRQNNHISCYKLRTDCVLERTGAPQARYQLAMCPCGKGSQHCPGLCLEESCQQVQEGGFSPWLNLMETTFRVLCLVLGSPVEERHGLVVCIQKRTTKTV